MRKVAVVLAGGSSTRYGECKALIKMSGKPMIECVIEALRDSGIFDEIVVSLSSGSLYNSLSRLLKGVKYVFDEVDVEGPHAGIVTAMIKYRGCRVQFVPCDMPWIVSDVFKRMDELMTKLRAQVLVPMWGNGVLEPLLSMIRVDDELVRKVMFSLRVKDKFRPTDIHRCSNKLVCVGVSRISNDIKQLLDVDKPEDVDGRSTLRPTSDIVVFEKHSELYMKALKTLSNGVEYEAGRYFVLEGEIYDKCRLYHLAYHAYIDALLLNVDVEPELVRLRNLMGIKRFHE